jgi:hypothetical protein
LLLLGFALALSNWLSIRENVRLREHREITIRAFHTPVGARLPPLAGKDNNGNPVKITYEAHGPETLMLVFSPTCGHCRNIWPKWIDLIKGCKQKRVVFVDSGTVLTKEFLAEYDTSLGQVIAEADRQSIVDYRFRETPITLLVGSNGVAEGSWGGELSGAILDRVKKDTGWRPY